MASQQTLPEPKRPSLIHPDFTGLWSVGKLGGNKTRWSQLAGLAVVFIFIHSWIGGLMLPWLTVYLLYIQYYNKAIILFLMLFSPYFLPISPRPFISRFYMFYGAHYFSGGCSMSFEGELSTTDAPICAAAHPHGLLCLTYFLAAGIRFKAIEGVKDNELKKQIVGKMYECPRRMPQKGILDANLCKLPLFNLIIVKLSGCVESSSKRNMKNLMRNRESFGILPGAFHEATLFRKGEHAIFIKNRKGFIKYCLQYGYEILPAYLFGESETYNNLFVSQNQYIRYVAQWLNKKRIPTVLPIGPYWFCPFLPYRNIGLHSIFSGNTRCQQIDDPSQKEIDEMHEWYINEVTALFERNKWRFGYGKETKLKVY